MLSTSEFMHIVKLYFSLDLTYSKFAGVKVFCRNTCVLLQMAIRFVFFLLAFCFLFAFIRSSCHYVSYAFYIELIMEEPFKF